MTNPGIILLGAYINMRRQDSVEDIQTDLVSKVNALQAVQKKPGEQDEEVGQFEAEVLRLKAITGNAETLIVIKRELLDLVAEIQKLEAGA